MPLGRSAVVPTAPWGVRDFQTVWGLGVWETPLEEARQTVVLQETTRGLATAFSLQIRFWLG